ncbi:hypothetical protein [Achromobacter aloeverae]
MNDSELLVGAVAALAGSLAPLAMYLDKAGHKTFYRLQPAQLALRLIPIVLAALGTGMTHIIVPVVCFWLSLAISGLPVAEKTIATYKGVRVSTLQEGPRTWSIHLAGGGFAQILRWTLRRARAVYNANSISIEERTAISKGAKLFHSANDRARLNEIALEAFVRLLDELAPIEGAVIVSASPLNLRTPHRLVARIQALENHGRAWRFEKIERRLGLLESLIGRFFWKWPKEASAGVFSSTAHGIIVWRADDPPPNLKTGMRPLD